MNRVRYKRKTVEPMTGWVDDKTEAVTADMDGRFVAELDYSLENTLAEAVQRRTLEVKAN